jgi:hypothetical protein
VSKSPRQPAKQGRSRRRTRPKPAKKRDDRDKLGRFLPGMSGNPNGRPRLSKGVLALRAALEEIETELDGMPVMAVALRLREMAMKGGAQEMRLYLQARFGLPKMVDVPEGMGEATGVESTEYRVRFKSKAPVTPEAPEPNGSEQLQ